MITIRIGRKRIRLDPIETLQTFQRLEIESRIKDRTPNVALLESIAAWLSLFRVDATPTQAWCVWVLVWEYVERVGQREAASADIAFWYGINPFGLKPVQRLSLWANLGRVQAQHQLTSGRFDPCDYKAVYKLVLLATGDETLAQKAKADAAEAFMHREMERAKAAS